MNYLSKIPFQKLYLGVISFFCLVLPIKPHLTSFAIILFALVWLLEGNFKERFSLFKKEKFRYWLLVPAIYYLFHIIGILYSKNVAFGLFDLQIKLPLLLFPLFFATTPTGFFSKKNAQFFFLAFIIGILIFSIYSFATSVLLYKQNPSLGTSLFFYSDLTKSVHPSYAALYSVFCVFFAILLMVQTKRKFLKILFLTISLMLSAFTVFFASKAGILALLITWVMIIVFLLLHYVKSRLKWVFMIGGVALFSLVFFFAVTKIELVSNRFAEMKSAITTANITSGSGMRIDLWRTAMGLIPKYFWTGTGTGDVKDIFINEYIKKGAESLVGRTFNPHSQFLQSFLALGIGGFLSLLVFLVIIPIYLGIKNKYPLLLLFAVVALISCLVESMLERQPGVMFFAFFYCLFIMQSFYLKKGNGID